LKEIDPKLRKLKVDFDKSLPPMNWTEEEIQAWVKKLEDFANGPVIMTPKFMQADE
jgi:hypothetical protein